MLQVALGENDLLLHMMTQLHMQHLQQQRVAPGDGLERQDSLLHSLLHYMPHYMPHYIFQYMLHHINYLLHMGLEETLLHTSVSRGGFEREETLHYMASEDALLHYIASDEGLLNTGVAAGSEHTQVYVLYYFDALTPPLPSVAAHSEDTQVYMASEEA